MSNKTIPATTRSTTVNLALAGALSLLSLHLYFLAPRLIAQDAGWAWSLLPAVLATQLLWALLHEGFHGLLHPRAAANQFLGRGLAVLFGSPFGVLRAGHLLHHRLNRSVIDRSEIYDPRATPRWRAGLVFYARLLGGLYLAEVAAALFVWLPRSALARFVARRLAPEKNLPPDVPSWLARELLHPHALWILRLDGLLVAALLAASAMAYGTAWPWLAAALAGRGLIVSLLDNAFHYGTALDDRRAALNFRLPAWAGPLVLHFNLHGVHHRFPGLPWAVLPGAFTGLGLRHDAGFVGGCLRQLRGPLPVAPPAPGRL